MLPLDKEGCCKAGWLADLLGPTQRAAWDVCTAQALRNVYVLESVAELKEIKLSMKPKNVREQNAS